MKTLQNHDNEKQEIAYISALRNNSTSNLRIASRMGSNPVWHKPLCPWVRNLTLTDFKVFLYAKDILYNRTKIN